MDKVCSVYQLIANILLSILTVPGPFKPNIAISLATIINQATQQNVQSVRATAAAESGSGNEKALAGDPK